jgi:hypothetical protein
VNSPHKKKANAFKNRAYDFDFCVVFASCQTFSNTHRATNIMKNVFNERKSGVKNKLRTCFIFILANSYTTLQRLHQFCATNAIGINFQTNFQQKRHHLASSIAYFV